MAIVSKVSAFYGPTVKNDCAGYKIKSMISMALQPYPTVYMF